MVYCCLNDNVSHYLSRTFISIQIDFNSEVFLIDSVCQFPNLFAGVLGTILRVPTTIAHFRFQ